MKTNGERNPRGSQRGKREMKKSDFCLGGSQWLATGGFDHSTGGYVPEVLIEDRKVRYLRLCVDLFLTLILQGQVGREEAVAISRNMRHLTLSLFPDKGTTFDIIYAPRFRRAIDEVYGAGDLPADQEQT